MPSNHCQRELCWCWYLCIVTSDRCTGHIFYWAELVGLSWLNIARHLALPFHIYIPYRVNHMYCGNRIKDLRIFNFDWLKKVLITWSSVPQPCDRTFKISVCFLFRSRCTYFQCSSSVSCHVIRLSYRMQCHTLHQVWANGRRQLRAAVRLKHTSSSIKLWTRVW